MPNASAAAMIAPVDVPPIRSNQSQSLTRRAVQLAEELLQPLEKADGQRAANPSPVEGENALRPRFEQMAV